LPNPTTTGPGTVVLVVAADVVAVVPLPLLLPPLPAAPDVDVVAGGSEARELPRPQPEAATRASTRADRHDTERRQREVTDRFC